MLLRWISICAWLFLSLPSYGEYQPSWSNDKKLVLVGRLNPRALMIQGSWDKKYSYSFNDELGIEDGYFQYGAVSRLSPASAGVGGTIEWLPLVFLQLTAETEVVRYFGNFSNVLTFNTISDDYSDDARNDLEDQAQSSTLIHHKLDAVLRGKVGSIIGRYVYSSEYFDFDVNGNLVYEPGYDLLMENKSYINTHKFEFFYEFPSAEGETKLLGVFHESNKADSTKLENTKLGLQTLWSDKLGSDPIKWLGQFGQHLKSRYRKDEYFVTVGLIKSF